MSQQNTDHIQITHMGSLPRPHELLDQIKAKYTGQSYDEQRFESALRRSVEDSVREQAACGIDYVTDGEFSKPGFFSYIQARLDGFEPRNQRFPMFEKEVAAFPEYYEEYFKAAMLGGAAVPMVPMVCVGPVRYKGEELLRNDIANVKAAAEMAGVPHDHIFLPATAPSGVGRNEYYKSDEEFFHALAVELAKEYRTIAAAGLIVQIDDPFLPDIFVDPHLDEKQMKRKAEIYVDATNAALKGVPTEQIRFHTCYGINEGPRIYEAALSDIIRYVLKVRAGQFSFEAANPRHEHEYHLFEDVKVPDGRVVCPGVITHASNIVEHPQLIAERLMRFAKLVGRENVMAGADCGFSSQALYHTEVHPTVVWEKFKAMREGADIATQELWKRKAAKPTRAAKKAKTAKKAKRAKAKKRR